MSSRASRSSGESLHESLWNWCTTKGPMIILPHLPHSRELAHCNDPLSLPVSFFSKTSLSKASCIIAMIPNLQESKTS